MLFQRFDFFESETESINKKKLINAITTFRERVNISNVEFEEFYKHLIKREVLKRNPQWNFSGSFFFCTLGIQLLYVVYNQRHQFKKSNFYIVNIKALTLIGYGHTIPQSVHAKIVFLFYMFIGKINFCLMFFQHFIKPFTKSVELM